MQPRAGRRWGLRRPQHVPADVALTFASSALGTRAFDYWFEGGLTTHTPDVERIQAAAEIAGRALTGGPSNLEPRLVTQDGVPCASIVAGGDGSTPHFVDTGGAASGVYDFLHEGAVPWVYYLLHRRVATPASFAFPFATSDGSARGVQIRFSSTGICRVFIGGGASTVFDMQTGSADIPADVWFLLALIFDGAGNYQIRVNDVQQAAQADSGGYGTGVPGQDPVHLNAGTALNLDLEGFSPRIICYRGVDHGPLSSQFYELVKTTYPTLSLP